MKTIRAVKTIDKTTGQDIVMVLRKDWLGRLHVFACSSVRSAELNLCWAREYFPGLFKAGKP